MTKTQVAVRRQPLVPQTVEEAFRFADMMARGDLVPDHLKGKPANCLLVVEQAMRWQMSPFAVAACTSVVRGRLMYEGKLVAAAVEAMGAIDGYFHFAFAGAGADRKVTVSATRHGEKEPVALEVEFKKVRTANEIWDKQPDQQLCYAGVRIWARRYTPAAILGVYTRDEFEGNRTFDGETIDAVAEPAGDERDRLNASIPLSPTPTADPPRPKYSEWYAALGERLAQAQSVAGIEAIKAEPLVISVLQKGSEKQKSEVEAMLAAAVERVEKTLEREDRLK